MSFTALNQITGIAAIITGVFSVLSGMPDQFSEKMLRRVRWIANITALIAVTGIYFHQREASGTIGLIAFVFSLVGLLMLIVFSYEMGLQVFALGVILLAIAALQSESFPRWVPWMWLIAPLLGIPGYMLPKLQLNLVLFSSIAFGLGFVGAGFHLFSL